MDEHGMLCRASWAWIKHRHKELGRPVINLTDEEFNDLGQADTTTLSEGVYRGTWGGPEFVYSLGDSHQLPPVAMKNSYDKSALR